MIIGITGTSGSGKSTAAEILGNKLNYSIVDADVIAKRLSKKGSIYYNEIIEAFGEEILDEQKEIIRSRLARIVYNDSKKREILNGLTNIYVVEEIKKQVFELYKSSGVIMDVPRLIESGLNKICDVTIGVIADEELKLDRICKRDNIDKELARRRLEIQPNNEFYIKNLDHIIENNLDSEIEKQLDSIIENF